MTNKLELNKKNRILEMAPFLFLFLAMLFLHSLTRGLQGDDLWFSNILNDQSIFEYWNWRYETWSSRLIIETVLIYLSMSKHWIWCLLDSLMFILLAYSISELFVSEDKKLYGNWIVVSLILCYPFVQLSSAGWLATTLNYLWPLSLGMFAFIPLKRTLCHEKVPASLGLLSIFAIFYAGNTEQMGAIIVCVYGIFFLYLLYIKEMKSVVVINLMVSLSGLLFVITCPGNKVRSVSEMHWFEGYENLGIMGKLKYGFLSSTVHFFENTNIMFFLFTVLLLVCIWMKYQDKMHRAIGALPLLLKTIILTGTKIMLAYFPDLGIYHSEQDLSQIVSFSGLVSFLYICVNAFMIVLIIVCIYFVFGKSKETGISLLILTAGLTSRVIMGFSPTVFASGLRTFIYLYFSLLIVILFLVENIFSNLNDSNCKVIICLFLYVGIIQFLGISMISVTRLPLF
ncbi:DUF6056 family protein [Eubacterium callanderi]|uniref:DUF6056 family protein n=1 Tax=Eubacterium callanderi TaxID=53442 RepID=UPI003999A434